MSQEEQEQVVRDMSDMELKIALIQIRDPDHKEKISRLTQGLIVREMKRRGMEVD